MTNKAYVATAIVFIIACVVFIGLLVTRSQANVLEKPPPTEVVEQTKPKTNPIEIREIRWRDKIGFFKNGKEADILIQLSSQDEDGDSTFSFTLQNMKYQGLRCKVLSLRLSNGLYLKPEKITGNKHIVTYVYKVPYNAALIMTLATEPWRDYVLQALFDTLTLGALYDLDDRNSFVHFMWFTYQGHQLKATISFGKDHNTAQQYSNSPIML
jgi:hypothetical protein